MTRWERYLALIRGGDPARVKELVAAGKTIELRDLDRSDTVVRIRLGFGDEFWRVEPGYRVHPMECLIEGGRLILEGGTRVTEGEKFSFLARKVEQIVYSL
jgi:hypothetical protein